MSELLMTFILPCPSGELISLEKQQIKLTSQEKDRGLGFSIIHRRGDFFSFPSQVLSISRWSRITILPADSANQYTLFFVTVLGIVLFSPRKAVSLHPCGYLLFFGIKRKMNFPTARKHVKPHLQTEAVLWLQLAI